MGTYLGLGNNRISHIPKFIGQFKALKHLSVNSNPLVQIPHELRMLKGLSSLFLQNTNLKKEQQVEIFCNLKACQTFLSQIQQMNEVKSLEDWCLEDVCSYLEENGALDNEMRRIKEERIDGGTLVELSEDDLRFELEMSENTTYLIQQLLKE